MIFYKVWELSGSKLVIFIMFGGSGDLKCLFSNCFKPLEFQKLDFYKRWELSDSKLLIFIMFEGSADLKCLFLQALGMFFLQTNWFYEGFIVFLVELTGFVMVLLCFCLT